MIKIIDYGMGNLRSVQKTFEKLGYEAQITSKPVDIEKAKGIILPGVGAFEDAIKNLKLSGLVESIYEAVNKGVPFLGICLGMQMLLSISEENGIHEGLNIIPGKVIRLPGKVTVPHMGWNQIEIKKQHPLLKGINVGDFVYFVHSYYVVPDDYDNTVCVTDYGVKFSSIIADKNIMGIQFHPEKSGGVGLKILENYGELVKNAFTAGN
jgi:glutamine amidotransferase